jgi:hypothetical protein
VTDRPPAIEVHVPDVRHPRDALDHVRGPGKGQDIVDADEDRVSNQSERAQRRFQIQSNDHQERAEKKLEGEQRVAQDDSVGEQLAAIGKPERERGNKDNDLDNLPQPILQTVAHEKVKLVGCQFANRQTVRKRVLQNQNDQSHKQRPGASVET